MGSLQTTYIVSGPGGKTPHSLITQARALGAYFSSTPFTAIHTSPLKRALSTAQALHDAQSTPKPPLTTSLLLREQHFGIGEGKVWVARPTPGMSREEQYARGIFAAPDSRSDKFPDGESLDDLARRAQEAAREIILPYVWKAVREGSKGDDMSLAIVSHGLCISELVTALVSMDAEGQGRGKEYRGLVNTAWTRVRIDIKGGKQGEPLTFTDNDPPQLVVRVTDVNSHEHLNSVKWQKGIGGAAYDPSQKDIRAFFGGEVKPEVSKPIDRNVQVGLKATES